MPTPAPDGGRAPGAGSRSYLDHASTSPLRPSAAKAMLEWLDSADPGRIHTEGRMARSALEDAREAVAALFGTRSRQVVFTSGATESINAAVYGALRNRPGGTVVLSDVEHSAVREASARYARAVRKVGAGTDGTVDADEIRACLEDPEAALVHCQLANHEVGTVQPVKDVVAACRARGVMVHVDAAAGAGHLPIAFDALGADLMSLSAHKFGGPKGIGAMLVRRGLRVEPLLVGGDQERARRAGLENVAAAVGFGAVATELAAGGTLGREAAECERLASRVTAVALAIPGVSRYGPCDPERRLPHIVCLGVAGVEAEPVLIGLDQSGVAAHSGSSCSSESLEPSPVLAAMGADSERSLRISVGWSTTDRDVDALASALPAVVERLRYLGGPPERA